MIFLFRKGIDMRRFVVILPAILLWTAATARGQGIQAGVDPRVEFLSILFRLAGNAEYHQCRVPAYDKAIDAYFAPYRDHQAVQLARSLKTGFEGPMKLAVYLRDAASLDELVPFDRLAPHLYPTWDPNQARAFLDAARQFTSAVKFQEFLQSQQPLYEVTNSRLQVLLENQADLAWFARFFGSAAPPRFVVVPGLANGPASYAAHVTDGAGMQEFYAIPGVSTVDADGLPVFDANWRTNMVHQFAHAYTGPAVTSFRSRLEKPARQIYEQVATSMRRQSYATWVTMMNESLARAVAIEYVAEHDGPQGAQTAIRREQAHSFFWMSGLVKLFDSYRADRRQYPDFESYMPRVADYFDNLAPRIQTVVDRLQPKVISTSIADGARNVDPGTMSIVVRFSMPMNRLGPFKDSKLNGGRFDAGGTSVTIPVSLEPGRDYAFPLRWAGGQNFVSADGVPLPEKVLRFHTAAAPPAKQP